MPLGGRSGDEDEFHSLFLHFLFPPFVFFVSFVFNSRFVLLAAAHHFHRRAARKTPCP